ncbi:OmpA family protein [Knoellia sp. CPCC 206435]|uniref:channel-forming protein ArfA/OmpATb n=1 Tax=Knoellia terrae TaxID=3404797 RepID=UPI003B42B141
MNAPENSRPPHDDDDRRRVAGAPGSARVDRTASTPTGGETVTRRYRRGLGAPWWLALVGVPAILAAVGLGLDGDDDARAAHPATSQGPAGSASPSADGAASPFSVQRVGNEVTLTGTVPDESARSAIVDDVKGRLPGVNVVDNLQVAAGAPAAGAAVTALAEAASAEDFSLEADGETVVLKGVAASEEAKAAAETAAKSTFPGATVDNQLTVGAGASPSASPSPSPSASPSAGGDGCATLATDIKAITERTKITFPDDQATPTPASRTALKEIAQTWKACPEAPVVRVGGYTSAPGSAAKNLRLSDERARNVRAVLIQGGIGADKVVAKGYGETTFIASNSTEAGREANRRVEITVG